MTRARSLLRMFSAGILSGVIAGIVDAWTTAHQFLGVRFLQVALADWVLLLGTCGGLCGLLVSRNVSSAGARFTLASLFVLPLAFLLFVGVNVSVLGPDTGKTALIVDVGILLLAVAVTTGVGHFLRSATAPAAGWKSRLTSAPGMFAGAVALAGLALVTWRGGRSDVGPPANLAPAGAPDVVLVLIDTLEGSRLSCAGSPRGLTPELDRVARRGLMFREFSSQSCYTKPAVASLLTSLIPSGHRVGNLETVLDARLDTLAERFHEAGFRTAMFCANAIIGAEFGFAQGAEIFRTVPTEELGRTKLGYALRRIGEERGFAPAKVVAQCLRSAEHRLFGTVDSKQLCLHARDVVEGYRDWKKAQGSQPTFAYLHFMEPHAPYRPPLIPERRLLESGISFVEQHPSMIGHFLPFTKPTALSEPDRKGLIAAYEGEIAALDRELGDLFAELANAERPTVLAVTADHGEEFFEHGAWGHGHSLHEELVRVPGIIAGGAVDRRGVSPCSGWLVDLGPTLLELAGVAPPADVHGKSLVPLLDSKRSAEFPPIRETVAEIVYGDTYWARSLEADFMKIIVSRFGEEERVQLFDPGRDPGELRDLAPVESLLVSSLRDRLEAHLSAASRGDIVESRAEFDEATIERLRALGYLR